MKKWYWMTVGAGGDSLYIDGTHAPTIEWLIGEAEKRLTKAKVDRYKDADGVLYMARLKAKAPEATAAVLRRLLGETGWEPFQAGGTFKRMVEE